MHMRDMVADIEDRRLYMQLEAVGVCLAVLIAIVWLCEMSLRLKFCVGGECVFVR